MSFFNKAMASIGIGSAKVETYIDNEQIRVGGEFRGMIEITGGSVEQKIDKIHLELKTYYMKRVDGKQKKEDFILQRLDLADTYIIPAGEKKMVQFTFPVPLCTPITIEKKQIWLETRLDIKEAFDPADREDIEVAPHPMVQKILNAMEHNIGFSLHHVENDFGMYPTTVLPYKQVFEFRPQPIMRDRFDRVRMTFLLDEQGLEIIINIDKNGNFFEEIFSNDISYANFLISILDFGKTTEEVAELLYDTLMQHA